MRKDATARSAIIGNADRGVKGTATRIAPRDLCWRCGVRGDVGCIHQPLMSA